MRRRSTSLVAGLVLAAVLAAAAPGSAVGPPAPQAGLVLHYPMESITQGTVADASGQGSPAGSSRCPALRG